MKYLYSFFDDISEGAHPRILEALAEKNRYQELGYGNDRFCHEAAELIRGHIGDESVDVHFVTGGTQANLVVFASLLKPYESVITAETGHINVHEAGAIEATGHKVHGIANVDGKLTPQTIRDVVALHTNEHMVSPKAVFISHATELGTIYKKSELEAISDICKEFGLYLYVDGARLGSALVSDEADIQMKDIAPLVDIFYIGGTKNGALLGEAIVIKNPLLKERFRYHMKQRGALLSKGRVLGIQFAELFRDDLFYECARHAYGMAQKLAGGIAECGYSFLSSSSTNLIFPIMPNSIIEKLQQKYGFYVWQTIDQNTSCIRLATSWSTSEEAVDGFLEFLKNISKN